ncbi:MAG: hypothetical protein HQL94_08125 [Magnetococcales bacterium]|nr:hypothetical protein [Magnetococcales bacterium]MBF0439976.1 hypothetical protein [Magnetococcales bacterium]
MRVALWLMIVMGMVWSAPLHAQEIGTTPFRDDFNRPDGENVGAGWNTTPNHNECPLPDGKKPPPARKETRIPEDKNLLYDEISKEIEKKHEKTPSKQSLEGFSGTTARIRDNTLFFQYEQHQDAQMVQQEFAKKVGRLTFDYTPLYAMGGLDDRAWFGVRIYYLDADDLILGEIRHFFYHAVFDERENTDRVHTILKKGNFDGTTYHANVDAQQILNQHLRGVDQKRIAKTRLSFELASGLCESSVEGFVDNVVATLEEVIQPFQVTTEILLDITETGISWFAKDRQGFPGNWKNGLFDKYGKQHILGWLKQIPRDARGDLGRMTDFLMQGYKVTGRDAWLAANAVTLLMQSM